MKKIYEYTTIIMSVVGTFCMIGAAGAIDGGYKGVPMNDNWLLCGSLFLIGVASFILALYSQVLYSEADSKSSSYYKDLTEYYIDEEIK